MSENAQQETVTIGEKVLPVEVVNGKKQAKDADGNVYVLGPQPTEPRKPNKIDLKRMQQHQERRKRLLGKGVPEEKVDMVMAEEDYRALPVEQKLERFIMNVNQSFRLFGEDIQALHHNSTVVGDAIDVNSRAIAMCFEKLGFTLEQQSDVIKEATKQINEERAAAREAATKKREEELKQKAQDLESFKAEAELKKAEGKPELVEEAGEPAPIPEGATTFGG